ncbi:MULTISPECIES: 4-(cytidine 5'-diphospho)-2-C-methyl-D-erythritol kinase [unclassified Caulobacter]|uniref:4-(cytidine 5'-diphospho)-2-C-methyl-D-erythritol kinase n=1 Tax=unclassified Caulobacter TaxID=2648921 RepID=UPI000D394093|nr:MULTISPECIES: 4-(cytidine 5'-diphospho)-2-C-methyl-D-erythritol kinase [unclassified Caulobacter]PTS90530.1 4-(cytidine 5'-diphospho)-2-C-methyl-D-erythritol kinase [Caulobacter sp. HMWF009]PTT04691.1 4-(cytidine 5'-diphospho)-2-C-methyl-D-erythritol kinase [Caulobacter sp. HMWF025]
MRLSAFAPAKVNLFLHVGGPDDEGYHPISSLMVFADVGDAVALQASEALAFETTGPFGSEIPAGDDNLVMRAVAAFRGRIAMPLPPFRLLLDKRLPIAAGLGGGSSDAGAALRLLRDALAPALADADLETVAGSLGADGAVCLWGRPALAEGRGERLSAAPELPPLHAVLVNPLVPSPTGAVYRAYDAAVAAEGEARPWMPEAFESAEEVAAWLAMATRNDLEAPAVRLEPLIGQVLETLRDEPEVLLARMSGSGATCFALCAGDFEAEGLAERLQTLRPDWWVRRCILGEGTR